jgi:membrane-associated phospholipid phosphatase
MKKLYAMLFALVMVLTASAEAYIPTSMSFRMQQKMEQLNEETALVTEQNNVTLAQTRSIIESGNQSELQITAPGVKRYQEEDPNTVVNTREHPYYNWKRDVTYAGIPIFLASFIIKDQKKAFRSARMSMNSGFKAEWDNYSQFAPYAAIVGMKAFGYHGRSDWARFLVSTAAANAIMAGIVNITKNAVGEMRPDNSSANSFPSGHTATAFVAATILHKEYGLTRSPWFSVAGYACATATGVMRVFNNRHWVSDVVAGAGVGILSTELGYWIGDLIFKNRGIKHFELANLNDSDRPSFFDINMGVGLHSKNIDFTYDIGAGMGEGSFPIEVGTSTAFGVEGAYFFNKNWGVGGMARVTTTPSKGLNYDGTERKSIQEMNVAFERYDNGTTDLHGLYRIEQEDNQFIDASIDVGAYFNLPLGDRFALGAKALLGARISDGISFKGVTGERLKEGNNYVFEDSEGNRHVGGTSMWYDPGYNYVLKEGTIKEYDLLRIKSNTSFNYVLGVNFTYRYKSNFSWKVFVDFDSSKKHYELTSTDYTPEMLDKLQAAVETDTQLDPQTQADWLEGIALERIFTNNTAYSKKWLNFFTIGAAFSVNF